MIYGIKLTKQAEIQSSCKILGLRGDWGRLWKALQGAQEHEVKLACETFNKSNWRVTIHAAIYEDGFFRMVVSYDQTPAAVLVIKSAIKKDEVIQYLLTQSKMIQVSVDCESDFKKVEIKSA